MVKKHGSAFSSLCFSKTIPWPPRETIDVFLIRGCLPGGLFLHCASLFVTQRSQASVTDLKQAGILSVVELLWVSVEAE